MNTFLKILLAAVGILGIALLAFWGYQNYLAPQPEPAPAPQASLSEAEPAGVVSAEGQVIPAEEVTLAFTQAGRVAEVLVEEGQSVQAGDVLVRLEDGALIAAVEQAEAGLATTRANLAAAEIRLDQARAAAQAAERPGRITAWSTPMPPGVDQPGWFFDPEQERAAAEAEVDAARQDLESQEANLQEALDQAASDDLLAAETRLAEARAAFLVAKEILDRTPTNDPELRDEAQRRYDITLSKLEAAQDDYDQVLTTESAADILEARARVAVARERYDTAVDRLNALNTGEDSLEIQAAQTAYDQAEAAVAEAEAAVRSAQWALEQATLAAPISGVVAVLEAAPGEVVTPGREIVILANLLAWQVKTTDLAESDVALVQVGQPAEITLDAFPDQTFAGVVTKIALVNEDTRGSVTYEVWVSLEAGGAPVRWGMTAFVNIDLSDISQ